MNEFDKLLKAIASGLKAFADGIEAMSVEMGKKEETAKTEEPKSKPKRVAKSRKKPAEPPAKEPVHEAPKKPSRRKIALPAVSALG